MFINMLGLVNYAFGAFLMLIAYANLAPKVLFSMLC
jgi:hypothetical protein